ncbi:flagellar hook-length control protein FliK [Paenibacillus sp. OSY-SE]|uniref:flagellar hook-length control protein FliK n=1 Tax=Paenibacillus sp. OSY-SE TaxID=1196323 RepID=UPI0002EB9775|nr:flagellar hook-length control protein FliK [Paenibacillus sp. OSY-SE]
MSGAISNVSASNAASFLGGVQAKGTGAGEGNFWVSLSQCMNGTGEQAAFANNSNGLFVTQEGLGNLLQGETEQLAAALDQLFAEPLKLADEQLEANPELLAALQQWVLQAQQWLSAQPSAEANATGNIQTLTEQPETITLAVRDVMQQLSELMAQGEGEDGQSVQHLLNGTLTAAIVSNEHASGLTQRKDQSALQQTNDEGFEPLVQASITNNGHVGRSAEAVKWIQQLSNVLNQAVGSNTSTPVQGTTFTAHLNGVQNNMLGTVLNAPAVQSNALTADSSDSTADVELQAHPNQVTTAGQWALRQEGINTAKQIPVVHADRFADEMAGFVVKQLRFSKLGNVSEAKISLYPEHLGQVDVRLTMQNGQLTARFMTEHGMAKDMLEQQMSLLRGALQTQGIQVDKLEVSQQPASALSSSMFQEQRQPNANRQQTSERSSKQRKASEIDELNEALEGKTQQDLHENSTFTASV